MLLVPLHVTQFGVLRSKEYIEPIMEDDGVFAITAPYDPTIGLQITGLPQKGSCSSLNPICDPQTPEEKHVRRC
jgi:hypothetical protein